MILTFGEFEKEVAHPTGVQRGGARLEQALCFYGHFDKLNDRKNKDLPIMKCNPYGVVMNDLQLYSGFAFVKLLTLGKTK